MERVPFGVGGAQAHTAALLEHQDRGPPWSLRLTCPGAPSPPNPGLCRACPPPWRTCILDAAFRGVSCPSRGQHGLRTDSADADLTGRRCTGRGARRHTGRAHVCQPCPASRALRLGWFPEPLDLGGHFPLPWVPGEGQPGGGLSALGKVAASRALKAPRASRSPSSTQLVGPAGRAPGTVTALR